MFLSRERAKGEKQEKKRIIQWPCNTSVLRGSLPKSIQRFPMNNLLLITIVNPSFLCLQGNALCYRVGYLLWARDAALLRARDAARLRLRAHRQTQRVRITRCHCAHRTRSWPTMTHHASIHHLDLQCIVRGNVMKEVTTCEVFRAEMPVVLGFGLGLVLPSPVDVVQVILVVVLMILWVFQVVQIF